MPNIHVHTQSKRKTYYLLFLLLPAVAFVSFLASFTLINEPKKDDDALAAAVESQKNEAIVQIGELSLSAEIVDTEATRAQGLSGRRSLADNEGMLFDFGQENVRPPFWMKDMLMPIDIIWINDGVVVQIDADAQPEPGVADNLLKLYIPDNSIDFVLEVRAGLAAEKGVSVGSEFLLVL